MTRRKLLTQRQVNALPVRPKRYFQLDPEMAGHYVRVMPTGVKSFAAVARDPYGKQIWHTVGRADLLKIDEARDLARDAIKRITKGLPPKEPTPVKPDSYADVAANWMKRHVAKEKLISEREYQRILDKYVLPRFGERSFIDIKRSEIASLLDDIEDNHGPRQADLVMTVMRGISDWYIQRDDDYVSPFVRNMKHNKAKPRNRTLTDDEIRTVWKATEPTGTARDGSPCIRSPTRLSSACYS